MLTPETQRTCPTCRPCPACTHSVHGSCTRNHERSYHAHVCSCHVCYPEAIA